MGGLDRLRSGKCRLRWSRIDPDGPGLHEPQRDGDIGFDLEAAQDMTIQPGQQIDVPTNIRLELPHEVWAEVRARSSIAKRHLQVEAGTIDPGYRGPIFVLLRNLNQLQPTDIADSWGFNNTALSGWTETHSVTVHAGERVGQLVFHKVCPVWLEEVEAISLATDRGESGFGSTGK